MNFDLIASLHSLAVVLTIKAAVVAYLLLDRRRPKSQLRRIRLLGRHAANVVSPAR